MLQCIKDACFKMPAIPGGRQMPGGSKMFTSALPIMVKARLRGREHKKANEYSGVRYVNGHYNYHFGGVVFARWRRLGILTVAQVGL